MALNKEFPVLGKIEEREAQWIANNARSGKLRQHTPLPESADDYAVISNLFEGLGKQWRQDTLQAIQDLKQQSYVSKKDISWIDESDHRMLIFLLLTLTHPLAWNPAKLTPPHLRLPAGSPEKTPIERRHQRIIRIIDTASSPIARLLFLKETYAIHKLKAKDAKWLDKDNEEQLDWCLKQLNQKHYREWFEKIAAPVSPQEKYAELLAKLDLLGALEHPDTQRLTLEKLRRAWTQQKYRHSGKAKKQVSLALSAEARKKLEDLHERWRCPRNEVIERLLASYSEG